MSTMEGTIIMEDTDREWLQRELDEIKRRHELSNQEVKQSLAALPCRETGERVANIERGYANHVQQHKERWSKTQIVVVVSLGILGILSWIPKIADIFSNISK